MTLDAERAKAVLLETARTLDDEALELAVSDALATADVRAELLAMFASEASNVRRVACVLAGRRLEPEEFRQHLQERALDVDKRVATASVDALRERIRAQAVRDLAEAAVQATERSRRWILMDRAAKHGRGRKEVPPILRSILAPFEASLTPMEASRLNQSMKKGKEEYERGVRDRAQRKARST